MHAHHANADLLPELQRRVLAELDPPARLALFRCAHPLARTVLLHTPSRKRLAIYVSSSTAPPCPPVLAGLLDDPSLQPLVDLELCMTRRDSAGGQYLPVAPPPPSVTRRMARLHIDDLVITTPLLAFWRLHDPRLWPHLRHLDVVRCLFFQVRPVLLRPIPGLQSFTLGSFDREPRPSELETLGSLASHAQQLHVYRPYSADVLGTLVSRMQRLTRMQLGLDWPWNGQGLKAQEMAAMVRHPTLQHVDLRCPLSRKDLSAEPCRWRTLSITGLVNVPSLARLQLAGLERVTLQGGLLVPVPLAPERAGERQPYQTAGMAVLQQLHTRGALVLLPMPHCYPAFRTLRPRHADAVFQLSAPCWALPALARLVLEACPGLNTLWVDGDFFRPACLGEVVPLLRASGRVKTVCMTLAALSRPVMLGALPDCITRIDVAVPEAFCGPPVYDPVLAEKLRAAVHLAAISVRHPLTLTFIVSAVESVSLELEEQLRGLAQQGRGVLRLELVYLRL